MTYDLIRNWSERHALLLLILSAIVILNGRMELLSLGAFISFSSYIHRNSGYLANLRPKGGYANWTTGIRLLLIVISSFSFSVISAEWIFGMMATAVVLDVLDGYLARKFKQESLFGQFFDAEVDAFFVLIMCFYFFIYQEIGWWILVPGLLRYVYKMFTWLYKKQDFQETKKWYAAYVAGIFFIILLVSILLEMPSLLIVGSIAIVLSFLVSFVEYIRY